MLTLKQKELLLFIHSRLQTSGVPPSFDEMKEALDLKSKSGIHRLITALVERGFIRRLEHRARAIEVIKLPENSTDPIARNPGFAANGPGFVSPGFVPSVIEGRGGARASSRVPHELEARTSVAVPIMGRIAAGVPIEAIQNHSSDIAVPIDIVTGGEHFALEVRGDSMIDAGILEGDMVIIRRSDDATTGDIVVALVDHEEATLKRLRRKGGSVALEAANPAYETRIFGPDRVAIQGKLVGLIRRY